MDGGDGGAQTVSQVRLASPSSKDMRFEVYKEVKAPDDHENFLYFEVPLLACWHRTAGGSSGLRPRVSRVQRMGVMRRPVSLASLASRHAAYSRAPIPTHGSWRVDTQRGGSRAAGGCGG